MLVLATERAVVLEGTHNTRDFGGLAVSGGTVRAGMLYRSGALCFITPPDEARLRALGVQTVVDLRTPRERERDGLDRAGFADTVPHNYWWPMTNSRGMGQEAYHYLIRENPEVLRQVFALLARRESYPVLFHCSAGKDRAGIISALVLELLGASREVILDDYLQSQRNRAALVVNPEWIGEVFQAIEAGGGIRPFLAASGVTEEQMSEIARLLVTDN